MGEVSSKRRVEQAVHPPVRAPRRLFIVIKPARSCHVNHDNANLLDMSGIDALGCT